MNSVYTICWYGPIYQVSGYGSVSRAYLDSIRNSGLRIKVYNTGKTEKELIDKAFVRWIEELESTEVIGNKIILIHENPAYLEKLELKDAFFCALITIFETDRIPNAWVGLLNNEFVDEVWVPSEFNVETFSRSGVKKEKLLKIPYPIDISQYNLPKKGHERFRILYIADFSPRKNIKQLIEAFQKEFKAKDNVELLLHTTTEFKEEQKLFINSIMQENSHKIEFSTNKMDDLSLRELISSADLYISVDRANGWGMPVMEAMAIGTPVATINWSGSTEFANMSNSLLIETSGLEQVPFELVWRSQIFLTHKWASVNTSSIQEVLRLAYENSGLLEKLSKSAKEDILKYSPERIGALITSHLLYVQESLKHRSVGKSHTIKRGALFLLYKLKKHVMTILRMKIDYPRKFYIRRYFRRIAGDYLLRRGSL